MPPHCPWHPPTGSHYLDHGLNELLDYLKEDHTMTTYRDRHHAGLHTAPNTEATKTTADLKAALKALGQPVSGTKSEL